MSTRGVIARSTGEGTFAGRYHHWDSYPSGLGVALIELYRSHFKHDLPRMLQVLLDKHPAGWSTIVHKDFKLKPGYTNIAQRPAGMSIEEFQQKTLNRRPQCYCHGHRSEEGWVADEKSDCGAEWGYVFETLPARDDEPEQHVMHVLDRQKHADSVEYFWQDVGRIDLDSTEPINWTAIECGETFSRCSHVASYHGVDSPLSMQAYLGNHPLDPIHDPVAYRIDGKTYKATGSGGNSDYLNRAGKNFPANAWIASLMAQNNRRVELPIAHMVNGKYQLLPNVTAIYPPTAKVSA